MPTALRYSFLPLPDSLSTSFLSPHMSIYCFLHWNFAGLRSRKEHLRTVGMGGIRKILR
ncbi:hypothetical protein PVAP13_2KG234474 [Panicum virgatum]|uniref:Uncharacterized protein n=1 Tax=Panicum virgatum TaxID=38727 RepID=A0A8T0WF63_PANVG|nr:hypothetical protein PVAP13_2KG234474 [Panicum virgatum]